MSDVRVALERERCEQIVLNLARIIGTFREDPNPKFNTPQAICGVHGELARIAAEAIRSPQPKSDIPVARIKP